jgi:CDP-glucose 4,6-dehydratase
MNERGAEGRVDASWRGRRVFVTGATGVMGSWLVKALLERGASVVALVLDVDPRGELVQSGDFHQLTVIYGSLEDYGVLDRAIGVWGVDTIFHLGAQTLVGAALRSPFATFEANVRGTYNLLEACCRHSQGVRAIVVASSDKAYGSQATLPYTEATPLQPEHPYDASKACTDLIAQAYSKTYGLPISITRCGNIYGGGDLNWSRIVPGTILSLYRGERPLIRSDGKYVRDYLYVKDATSGYLRVAEAVTEGIVGEVFNLGADTRRTVLEIVEVIARLMGRSDLEPDIRNVAQGEIHEQWLSAEKAASVIGWTPAYSLERGLAETIDWYVAWLARSGERRHLPVS